jgi:hypothetical protein
MDVFVGLRKNLEGSVQRLGSLFPFKMAEKSCSFAYQLVLLLSTFRPNSFKICFQ